MFGFKPAFEAVDTDPDVPNLLVLKATCAGELNVITASSGAEGLEILAEREVAVLLVDQRMPGMTGVEVFEIARELYPDTVRILITAFTDLTEAVDAINRDYDTLARFFPEMADLDQVVRLLSLFAWLKSAGAEGHLHRHRSPPGTRRSPRARARPASCPWRLHHPSHYVARSH